jgi:D-3-phosphoglycerate dehydrogenase / 2-oxoglutarate reductase
MSFEELLRMADVLSIHTPLNDATRGLLDGDALALLPKYAIVVNTARGIVDEDVLVAAVASGRLRGAALDVLENEPPSPDDPLRRTSGILLTPHAAWYSEEAIADLRNNAMDAAIVLLRGEHAAGLVTA